MRTAVGIMAAFGTLLACGPTWAGNETEAAEAAIAPQPLTKALTEFAEQTGLQVVYPSHLTVGIDTKGSTTSGSPQETLDQLLADTGLSHTFINERTVMIESQSTPTGESTMTKDAIQPLQQTSPASSRNSSLLRRIAAVVAGLAVAAPVVAEEKTTGDQDGTIEEMVVTATYRDTRLMDTPIAISAVTDMDIANKGIEDIKQLFKAIPGLNFMTAASTYNQITIRGISPIAGGPSPVGSYKDMVPIGSSRGEYGHLLGSLFDMERVEVLKGPQGTLYGEGAMGGVVRYITKQPDPSGFDYSARVSMETMAHSSGIGHRADAMLNIPLGEQIAARLVLYSRDKKGLIDALGLRNERDVDWTEETGARLKGMVQPADNLTLTGMIDITRLDVGGPGAAFHCYEEVREDIGINEVPYYPFPGIDCSGDHNAQFDRDPYQTHLTHPNHPGGGYTNSDVYNLTAEWELPFAELTASYSYFESDWHYDEEAPPHVAFLKSLVERANCFNALPDGYCNGGGPRDLVDNRYSSQGAWGLRHNTTRRDAFEARLVSNTDSRFQWAVGAYYKDSENAGGSHQPCPSQAPYHDLVEHCALLWLFHPDTPVDVQGSVANWLNNNIFRGNRTHVVNTEESFFGEVSYRINDQWEILAGARTVDIGIDHDVLVAGVNPENEVQDNFTEQNKRTSPKVTITWRPADDWMVYGTWSHGFRPGVVNTRLVQIIAELEPLRTSDARAEELYQQLFDQQVTEGDEAFNYEVGVKATVADGWLSFTSALYFIDWESVMINTSATTPDIQGLVPFPLNFSDNVGSAESQGMELELRGALSDSLSWTLGANWMWKAEIGTAAAGNTARVAEARSVDVVPGNRLPSSPRTTGYGSLAYDFEIAGFNATARADAYWISSQWRGANNERVTPGHETVDVKLTLNRDASQFSFYVRNLFDEVIIHERNQVGYQFGRARTIGLEFNYNL